MMSNFNSSLGDKEPIHSTTISSNTVTISAAASSTTTTLSSSCVSVVSSSYGSTRRYGPLERIPHPTSPGNQQTGNGANAFMSALSMNELHPPPLISARLADNALFSAALMGRPPPMRHRVVNLGQFNYPNRPDPIATKQSEAVDNSRNTGFGDEADDGKLANFKSSGPPAKLNEKASPIPVVSAVCGRSAFLVRRDSRQTLDCSSRKKTEKLPLSDPDEFPCLMYGSSQPGTLQKMQLPKGKPYVCALKEPVKKPSGIDRFRMDFHELRDVKDEIVEVQTIKKGDKYGVHTDITDLWYTDKAASVRHHLKMANDMEKDMDNERIAFEQSLRDIWKNNDIFSKDNADAKGSTKKEVITTNTQLNCENEDEGEALDWITSDRWSTLQDDFDILKKMGDFKVTADGAMKNVPSSMVHNEFGLLGLMSYLEAKKDGHNKDNMVTDVDLSQLGLNLDSNVYLFTTFRGPWADKPYSALSAYQSIGEYELTENVRDKLQQCKYKKYEEEVLFYMFHFEMPGGDIQLDAACELYNRGWRFHKDLKGWISQKEFMPVKKVTKTHELGAYHFFDPILWKKVEKRFDLEYVKLEANPALNKTF